MALEGGGGGTRRQPAACVGQSLREPFHNAAWSFFQLSLSFSAVFFGQLSRMYVCINSTSGSVFNKKS